MIRNYTTQIAVEKTILEIEQLLIKFNAGGMLIGWGVGGITKVRELENQQLKSLKEFIDRK